MTLGLKDLYYAVCTEAEGAETYGAPKKMAEAMEADLSVKTETADLYADDALSESVKEFTNGTLKLGIKDCCCLPIPSFSSEIPISPTLMPFTSITAVRS